jgi:hypothetical protein
MTSGNSAKRKSRIDTFGGHGGWLISLNQDHFLKTCSTMSNILNNWSLISTIVTGKQGLKMAL